MPSYDSMTDDSSIYKTHTRVCVCSLRKQLSYCHLSYKCRIQSGGMDIHRHPMPDNKRKENRHPMPGNKQSNKPLNIELLWQKLY